MELFCNNEIELENKELLDLFGTLRMKDDTSSCLQSNGGKLTQSIMYLKEEDNLYRTLTAAKLGVAMFAEGSNLQGVYPTLVSTGGKVDQIEFVNVDAAQNFNANTKGLKPWNRNNVGSYLRFDDKSKSKRSIRESVVNKIEEIIGREREMRDN